MNLFKITLLFIFFIFPKISSGENALEIWFQTMSGEFLSIIDKNDENIESNLSLFISNNFAVNSISLSLIGNLAKKNNKTDLLSYQKAFKNHLTKTIYNLVENYDDQRIQFETLKKDDNGYLIYSKLYNNDESYSIVWRVVNLQNKYLILDVIIENTSYYVTKKSEFSKILRQNKGDIKKLTYELEKVNTK